TFSEDMNAGEVTNPANYGLFDAEGNKITLVAGDFSAYDTINFRVTISPSNGGNPLPSDTYTLFIYGDRVPDASGVYMAEPGQSAVPGGATPTASIVSVPLNGQLAASSNYPAPPSTNATTKPTFVTFGNFSGTVDNSNNPVPDLLV